MGTKFSQTGTRLIALIVTVVTAGFGIGPAAAQFYVRSPDVEKGELKFEEHGAIYLGPGEDERRRQSHGT